MEAPLISVLLPARNARATLERAALAMLGQTERRLELLIIDDGSTDGSEAIMEALAGHDPRVRILRTHGLGVAGALNLGWTQARAPLIARMDADDDCSPLRLQRCLERLRAEPRLAVVGTGVQIVRRDRPPSPNMIAYARWLSSLTTAERAFTERFIEAPLCHPSVLMRREAVDPAGCPPYLDGDFPEDYELWLRLQDRGLHLACVDELLFEWSDGPDRVTRVDPRYRPDAHLELKARYLRRALGASPLFLWGATDTGRGLARRLAAHGATIIGYVELDPRKLGQRIHGAPVVSPEQYLRHDGLHHVLCCVAARGAREEIRQFLSAHGRREGTDFTVVA